METFGENKRLKSIQYHSLMIAQALSYFIGYATVALMITQDELVIEATPTNLVEGEGPETNSLVVATAEESWFLPWRIALFL
jgi:hypothetical protein